MTIQKARSYITTLWLVAGCMFYLVVIIQTLIGKYDPVSDKVWAWALPAVMPTLSLMVGVHAARLNKPEAGTVDVFFFWLTLGSSAFYLLVVYLVILIAPFVAGSPLAIMEKSNLFLGPLQGLAAGAFAVFYVSKRE